MTPPKYSIDYAITVTLPSRTRKSTAETQFVMFEEKIKHAMRKTFCTIICELTSNFDVHFHAIAKVDLNKCSHPQKYLKDIFRADFGYTCVKPVEEFNGWIEYLLKSRDEINSYGMPLHHCIIDEYDVCGNYEQVLIQDWEPNIEI